MATELELDALPLPTDYRRPALALKGQRESGFGNLSNPLHHVQDPTGSLIVLGTESADPLFRESKSWLFPHGSLTISDHYPLIDLDVDILAEPVINVITIPAAAKSASKFYAANIGNAFTITATGTAPKYLSAALTWDATRGVSVGTTASTISRHANTDVSPPSKELRASSETRLAIDALIAAIYSGLVMRGATEVVEATLPPDVEAMRLEVAGPTLPAHAEAAKRLRDCADLTASEIAEVFGVRRETVQRWIGGGPINRHHAAALNFVDVLFREAIRRIGRTELENWVRMPLMSGASDSPKSPLDLLRVGRFDDVHRLVVALPDSNGEADDTVLALHRPEYRDED